MSNQRTSNKQILDAIENLTAAILATHQPTAETNSVAVEPEVQTAKPSKIKVSQAYFNAMLPKWQALANSKGVTYVGFAYRKSNGRIGLWAVPKAEIAKKQSTDSYIGNVAEVHPA